MSLLASGRSATPKYCMTLVRSGCNTDLDTLFLSTWQGSKSSTFLWFIMTSMQEVMGKWPKIKLFERVRLKIQTWVSSLHRGIYFLPLGDKFLPSYYNTIFIVVITRPIFPGPSDVLGTLAAHCNHILCEKQEALPLVWCHLGGSLTW